MRIKKSMRTLREVSEAELIHLLQTYITSSPLMGSNEDAYLIVWTTTPWTIPFNLGVMVNPELDYLKVKVDDEVWYVAKALAGAFIQGVVGKKLEILGSVAGL